MAKKTPVKKKAAPKKAAPKKPATARKAAPKPAKVKKGKKIKTDDKHLNILIEEIQKLHPKTDGNDIVINIEMGGVLAGALAAIKRVA